MAYPLTTRFQRAVYHHRTTSGHEPNEVIDSQLKLLTSHRRTLGELLQQQALSGSMHIPPSVSNGIREAREAIRQLKNSLRSLDVLIDDQLSDEPVRVNSERTTTPGSSTTRAGIGLTALAQLMQSGEVRAAVAIYRDHFKDTHERIASLGDYKSLHDLFQQLEQPHRIVTGYLKDLNDDPLAWDYVEQQEIELADPIDDILVIASKESYAIETRLWRAKLSSAISDYRRALLEKNVELLRNAINTLKLVIDRQISRINTRIVGESEGLRLSVLLSTLKLILDHLGQQSFDAETLRRLEDFRQGVLALAEINDRLTRSVDLHTLFQELDDELRRVDSSLEHDTSDLLNAWSGIKSMSQDICARARATWVSRLSMLCLEMDHSITTGQVTSIPRSFSKYRDHALKSFNRVDVDLRSLCGELQKIGDRLDLVLQVMQ